MKQIKRLTSFLKANLPGLYRTVFSLHFRVQSLMQTPRYLFCILSKRPYLGPLMLSAQTWPTRAPYMKEAIASLLRKEGRKESFNVLEIGSWAGQSAILWAKSMREHQCDGHVFCVDSWQPFASPENIGINTTTTLMSTIARRDKIFPLFWHNVSSAGFARTIIPLRGKSNDVLRILHPRSFDLVFVDGSHAYSDFLNDLILASPLVKEGGILCGDDLEMQLDDIDQDYAEAHCERDFITDPKTGGDFHPGVCLGISRFFKRRILSCHDGFWMQMKSGEQWTDVKLLKNA